VRNGTGGIIADLSSGTQATEWATVMSQRPTNGVAPFTRPAGFDTDGDGMPNAWEIQYGLNPNLPDHNGDFDSDGCTNLKEYINQLSEWPASVPLVFLNTTGDGRYARTTNWTANWQPSKFDTAKINSGSMTVDAVGQHAGTLLIGNDAGSSGRLNVTSGWINVAQRLDVGSPTSGQGSVVLSGGSLRVSALARVWQNGSIQFSGGSLDITGGAAIFDYSGNSPLQMLRQQIISGRNGGAWNGPGINSSLAAGSSVLGIGIAEASDLGLSLFAGQPVDATTVLIATTWLGDADLDARVNISDLYRLAEHWLLSGTSWTDGDFNYDGVVDRNDLALLAMNWQQPAAALSQALDALGLPQVSVPEPAASLAAAGGMILALRRRGRARHRQG
jgi:hypothetical protein